MSTPLTVKIPGLHPAQLKIKRERARFNVICCGRRFGKNVLFQDIAVERALAFHQPVGWAAPTYKMLSEDWRELTDILAGVTERRIEQEKQVRLIGGGLIDFWSLDNPDAIRGRRYGHFIVNEAGLVPKLVDIFNLIIRPTLIDFKGSADFGGTPKGMNGFYILFNQTSEGWRNFQMSSYANPKIPKSELDAMRLTMTERAFQQEIMAQFLEDGGGVFRGVLAAATAEVLDQGILNKQYTIGADWGRNNDATVFCVIDIRERKCVHYDRMTDTDFAAQRNRLKALSERFNHASCIVEQNSIGQPQLEELQRMGVPVSGFITTNASKAQVIDALSLAFERREITIPNDDIMIGELMAYQSERLPSGLVRYGAPVGMHDDIVIALALAWWGCASNSPIADQPEQPSKFRDGDSVGWAKKY